MFKQFLFDFFNILCTKSLPCLSYFFKICFRTEKISSLFHLYKSHGSAGHKTLQNKFTMKKTRTIHWNILLSHEAIIKEIKWLLFTDFSKSKSFQTRDVDRTLINGIVMLIWLIWGCSNDQLSRRVQSRDDVCSLSQYWKKTGK